MNCPRCDGTLSERIREGIHVDICDTCRGMWLDRGELENLLGAMRQDDEEDGDDEGGAPRGGYGQGGAPRRPRRWYDVLAELLG